MTEIPKWKVQAALQLLGLDPAVAFSKYAEVSITADEINWRDGYAFVTDAVADTRLHVLGIDPENGNAKLNPVADGDVAFFTGAGMYLDGLTKHANGTLMPIFKKADPE